MGLVAYSVVMVWLQILCSIFYTAVVLLTTQVIANNNCLNQLVSSCYMHALCTCIGASIYTKGVVYMQLATLHTLKVNYTSQSHHYITPLHWEVIKCCPSMVNRVCITSGWLSFPRRIPMYCWKFWLGVAFWCSCIYWLLHQEVPGAGALSSSTNSMSLGITVCGIEWVPIALSCSWSWGGVDVDVGWFRRMFLGHGLSLLKWTICLSSVSVSVELCMLHQIFALSQCMVPSMDN